MMDAPPAVPIDLTETTPTDVETHLPTEERADGSVLIDLTPLSPQPKPQSCIETDPNPLDNGILVCRNLTTDQRIDPNYGPTNEIVFGNAVPRAKFRISEDATGEVNATNPAVGGWKAEGVEAKVKIDF